MASSTDDRNETEANDEGPRKFTFPSHQAHMLTLAKMCQDNSDYTDCVIQCGDFSSDDTEEEHERNRLRAHRLVLGSASTFLKNVFRDIPQSLPEATILVPGVKRNVCQALLDFLYTGEMKVYREDTSDLQLLIETLQIDPELISVDIIRNTKPTEISESKNKSIPEEVESESRKDEGNAQIGERSTIEEVSSITNDKAALNSNDDSDSTNISNDNKKTTDGISVLDTSRKRKISEEKSKEENNLDNQDIDQKEAKLSKSEEKDS